MGQQLAMTGELFYRDSQFFSDFYEQTNAGGAISIRKPLTERTYIRAEYRLENIEIELLNTVAILNAGRPPGTPPSLLTGEGASRLV